MRVGIAGAGIAGLAVAWLLGEEAETVILESRDEIGGNARSVPVRLNGRQVSIELGAQDISAEGFPLHRRLLALLDYRDEDIRPIPASLSVRRFGTATPLLVTPADGRSRYPMRTVEGKAWEVLGLFLKRAVDWYERDVDWCVPFQELVDPLPVPEKLKTDLLYARPASLFCCGIEQVKEISARAAIHFYVAGGGEAQWQQLVPGLEGLAWALAAGAPRAKVKTGTALEEIRRHDDGFELLDAAGERHLVDRLVLAVPPPSALRLLAPLAGADELHSCLSRFRTTPAPYALHLDPLYMPDDRAHWATSNLVVDGDRCESCDWLEPVHGIPVFKSQIIQRDRLPERMLCRADFEHLLVTPDMIQARRRLEAAQGIGGLYFAGNHTNGVASQESALVSAMDVVRRITPRGPRLQSLHAA
ncbi:FAD-dependent oxidoreductase [Spirillospora sp. NPDC049652]